MALKTLPTKTSALTLIKALPDVAKRNDGLALLKIFKDATGMKPVVWGTSIIGFGMYHYESQRSAQKGDWPLVAFAPRASGFTLYIMPGFGAYKTLIAKLGPHKISGGSCLYIKSLSGIQVTALKTLITRSANDMQKKYGAVQKKVLRA
jgi:hypothetical protein